MPHSSLSHPDNLGINPYEMWWEDTYHEGIIAFLNNGVSASFPDNFVHDTKWDLSRNQCIYFDIVDPPSILVAEIPNLLKIAFKIVWDDITESIEHEFLDAISNLTGVPRGILELTKDKIRTSTSTDAEAGDEEIVEYRMSLDEDAATIFKVLLMNNNVLTIANHSIEYAIFDGELYNISNVTSTANDVVVNVEEDVKVEWSLVAFITLLVLNVIAALVGVGVYYKRKKTANRTDMYNQF